VFAGADWPVVLAVVAVEAFVGATLGASEETRHQTLQSNKGNVEIKFNKM
jgi:hypothetical protein